MGSRRPTTALPALDDHLTIGDALQKHYTAHGLPPDGGENQSWFVIRIGPLLIPLPNPGIRKRAVFYHDVHHLVTGCNTVFSQGEMIIAGHELGCGCGRFVFAWLANLWMFALGLLVTPRRIFAAFVRGRRCESLYRSTDEVRRERLLQISVREMKQQLGLDRPPPRPDASDRMLFAMWGFIAWLVTLGCAAVAIGIGWGVVAVIAGRCR